MEKLDVAQVSHLVMGIVTIYRECDDGSCEEFYTGQTWNIPSELQKKRVIGIISKNYLDTDLLVLE